MRILLSALLIAICFAAQGICGDKIYTWTDENGIKQYSDQPPENIDDYDTFEPRTSQGEPSGNQPGNEVRSTYKKMIQEVERENLQADQQKAEEARQKKLREKERADAARKEKIQAERDLLQKQIDALNARALSPTFTQGMRDNLIKKLKEQMDALESSATNSE